MRPSAHGMSVSPRLGMLMAFLTIGMLLPTPSRAGCLGHWLTQRSSTNGESTLLELLGGAGALANPEGNASSDRPTPPPCSGPMCSGTPAAPVSSTPSATPSPNEEWAVLDLGLIPAGTGAFHLRPVDLGLSPIELSSSIFHPPR